MVVTSSYRPRNPGHDYYGRGTYLITLVVRGRETLFGSLAGDAQHPEVQLSPLGKVVSEMWNCIPQLQAKHGNRVVVHACVCMPDHFHGVIEVLEPMQWSLGNIMQAFKSACTSWWQRSQGLPQAVSRPLTDIINSPTAPAWLRMKAQKYSNESELIRNLSKYRRQEYYALVGRAHRPLFDDNYDDTVCLDDRHREAMIAYVNDNPRRAILRRALPDVMQRCLHVQVGARSFGAFGNLFLLRWANKLQVQCHRKLPGSNMPFELSEEYEKVHQKWIDDIMRGATVIVTPGISRGELLMKNECLEKGFPLIHIQKDAINNFWKPERKRFEACTKGSLLILAPWGLDEMESVNSVPPDADYSRFHNLNRIAEEICNFYGVAKIIRKK